MMGAPTVIGRIQAEPTYPDRDLCLRSRPALPVSSRGYPVNFGMTETFGPHGNPEWFEYRVIDPVSGATLRDGEEGEFCVRGFGLVQGFYKKEREEVFDRDGWYHTGDRGYIENATIWFTGRYGDMIKSGGANVSPLEVEAALAAVPGVAMAFVMGLPDTERGQVVAAVVVPDSGTPLDEQKLQELLKQDLSTY
jgi:acyl-CoA synthetase (AMP-forming)/AMP-acid ligase II